MKKLLFFLALGTAFSLLGRIGHNDAAQNLKSQQRKLYCFVLAGGNPYYLSLNHSQEEIAEQVIWEEYSRIWYLCTACLNGKSKACSELQALEEAALRNTPGAQEYFKESERILREKR